jgi:AcrR family transcriptional regulator
MPHQTFFNLPAEKRDQILKVAIEEFAANDYDGVSITRIVARAGIAKGSFYQYFADKEDLYAHLLGLLVEAKTRFLSLDHPDPQHVGIFAYLRWMAEAGVAFELACPELCQIGWRSLNLAAYPSQFDAQARAASRAFYRRLVEVGKQQGDIDPALDEALAAFMFETILNSLGRYIRDLAGELETPGQNGRALFERPEVKEAFSRTIGILERGMSKEAASA